MKEMVFRDNVRSTSRVMLAKSFLFTLRSVFTKEMDTGSAGTEAAPKQEEPVHTSLVVPWLWSRLFHSHLVFFASPLGGIDHRSSLSIQVNHVDLVEASECKRGWY